MQIKVQKQLLWLQNLKIHRIVRSIKLKRLMHPLKSDDEEAGDDRNLIAWGMLSISFLLCVGLFGNKSCKIFIQLSDSGEIFWSNLWASKKKVKFSKIQHCKNKIKATRNNFRNHIVKRVTFSVIFMLKFISFS